MNARDELHAKLDRLSPSAVRFVTRIVDSISSPPTVSSGAPASWISSSPDWLEYFSLVLSVHHGTTTDPLALNGFETVFANACESVGWTVERFASATNRFSDLVVIDDNDTSRKLSLKSTAAKNISLSSAHISKLSEAAWIQDMRSARERRRRTLELFEQYMGLVDAIVMLRAFRSQGQLPDRYELIEVPVEIFSSLWDLPLDEFASDGPTLICKYGDEQQAARVALDRSDSKITIRAIKLSVCTVHAEWHLEGSQLPFEVSN